MTRWFDIMFSFFTVSRQNQNKIHENYFAVPKLPIQLKSTMNNQIEFLLYNYCKM